MLFRRVVALLTPKRWLLRRQARRCLAGRLSDEGVLPLGEGVRRGAVHGPPGRAVITCERRLGWTRTAGGRTVAPRPGQPEVARKLSRHRRPGRTLVFSRS